MSNFIDSYMDELSSIQGELMDRLELLIPKLKDLSTKELIEVARNIDFVKEMDGLGLGESLDKLYQSFNGEIASSINRAKKLGVAGISTANLQAIEAMRLLEIEKLGMDFAVFSSDLKRELVRGIISGTPARELSERLFENFGKDKILTSAQSRVLVNDSFARLSNATMGEVFK